MNKLNRALIALLTTAIMVVVPTSMAQAAGLEATNLTGVITYSEANDQHTLSGEFEIDLGDSNSYIRVDVRDGENGNLLWTSNFTNTTFSADIPISTTAYYEVTAFDGEGTPIGDTVTSAYFDYPVYKPGTVYQVTTERYTARNAITVNWAAPDYDGGAPITQYEILVVPSQSTDFIITTGNINSLTFDANIGETYTISLASYNGTYYSDFGPEFTETPGVIAPVAPTNIQGEVTSTGIDISWTNGYDGGSPINYASILVIDENEDVTFFDSTTSFLAANYETVPGATYTIRVFVSNNGGSSYSPYGEGQVTAPAETPDAPVVTVQTYNYYNPVLQVNWTVPNDNASAITGYDVLILDEDSNVVVEETVPASTTVFYSDSYELDNATEYTVIVTATNGVGTSSFAAKTATTLAATPPAVGGEPVGEGDGTVTAELAEDGILTVTVDEGNIIGEPALFAYLYPSATPLGWQEVGTGGVLAWDLSETILLPGTYHIAVYNTNGDVVGFTQFVISPVEVITRLATTGVDVNPLNVILFAAILVMLGVNTIIYNRRREDELFKSYI